MWATNSSTTQTDKGITMHRRMALGDPSKESASSLVGMGDLNPGAPYMRSREID
jgi:hypothetical protein